MEFKIDTKQTYVHITPISNKLDANLTAALSEKCEELTENGSQNYIIDLHNCLEADITSLPQLEEIHNISYKNNRSLVFTGVNDAVLTAIKRQNTDNIINIAPTLIEAIDIISMEILERDLFNEDQN